MSTPVEMADAFDLRALPRQHERLRRLARALVGDEHAAEDLAQDAWLRALERGPSEPAALGAWLASVARRLASNVRRGDRHRGERERGAARDEALPSSAEIAARVEIEAKLLAALEALDEPHRTALRDRYLGELSPAQLAARDALSLEAVKSRLRRARAALRERLERDGLGDEPRWQRALAPLVLAPSSAPIAAPAPSASLIGSSLAMKKLAAVLAVALVASLAAWRLVLDAPRSEAPSAAIAPNGTPEPAPLAPRGSDDREASARAASSGAEAAESSRTALESAPQRVRWRLAGHVRNVRGADVAGLALKLVMYRGFELAGEPLARFEVTSDAAGNFELALDRPDETVCFDLEVAPDPLRKVSAGAPVVFPRDEDPEPFDVVVWERDARVEGIVLDPNGRPVPGAEVQGMLGTAATAPDGRFSMAVCGRAYGQLFASAAGFGRDERVIERLAPGELARVEFALPPGATVRGTVSDEQGRPLSDARVRIFGASPLETRTDAAGRYAIDGLALRSGVYVHVAARADGHVGDTRELELDVEQPEIRADFELARGVRVHGRVLGPDGVPVAAAEVWLGWTAHAWDGVETRTDDDGRFTAEGVRSGRTKWGASKRGFAEVTSEADVHEGVELSLTLERPRSVRGLARDERGEPIRALGVAAKQEDEYVGGQTRTDANGAFELGGLPPRGDLQLEVYGQGFQRTYLDLPEGREEGVVITVPRAGVLGGRVVDAATNEPIRSFRVRIGWPSVPIEGEPIAGVTAPWFEPGKSFDDPQGRWSTGESDELRPGTWAAVEVSAPGYATRRIEAVEVSERDAVHELVYALAPPVRVEVSLRGDPGDEPIAGARIEARRPAGPGNGEPLARAETGAAGLALLEGLAPGEIRLRIRREGRADMSCGPFEIPEGPSQTTIELRAPVGRPLELSLLDAKHSPVSGERVQLFASQVEGCTGERVFATTDADGRARFEGVAPGLWLASRAVGEGDWPEQDLSRRVDVSADAAPDRVVLEPAGATTLVVRVEGALAPPDGSIVRVTSHGAPPRAATTKQGAAVIEGVGAGAQHVEISFWHPGIGRSAGGSTDVEVRAGDERVEVGLPVAEKTR